MRASEHSGTIPPVGELAPARPRHYGRPFKNARRRIIVGHNFSKSADYTRLGANLRENQRELATQTKYISFIANDLLPESRKIKTDCETVKRRRFTHEPI